MTSRASRWLTVATRVTAGLLLLIGAAAVDGCNRSAEPNSSKSIDVRLGYFANLTHAQAVLGVASGEFAQALAPHTLRTRLFNAGPSAIEALFAGEVDICYIGPGPALSGFEKSNGEEVRVVAGAAANGVVIVAAPNSGIKTLADLAGKRLATPQMGNTQDIAARHYLIHDLKQPNANTILPIPNGEQAAMMSRGQIDAAWAPEPWGERLVQEAGATIIAEEKVLWPQQTFLLTAVVVRAEFLQQHPDIVRRVLRVHAQWTQRLQADATQYVPDLAKALFDLTNKQLPQSVLERAIARISFTTDPMPETFETFARWSRELGFSKRTADLTRLIDATLLPAASSQGRQP